jgi:hypothetical protein
MKALLLGLVLLAVLVGSQKAHGSTGKVTGSHTVVHAR